MRVTDMQPGRRNKRRLNVYLDGEFAFACFAEIASQYGIRKGAELSGSDVEAVREADETAAAREYALNLAARGPRSEKQFREKLRARGYGSSSQEAALEVLRAYGYLDDRAYAEQYAAELFQKYGRWAVRRKLAERGIAPEIMEEVLAGADGSGALDMQLDRLLARPRYEDERRERDRIIRSLAAKGFDFDDIRTALERRVQDGGEER